MRIVCAGAGHTVIEAAPYIKKRLPQASVVVINKDTHHTVHDHVPELLSGKVHLDDISINLEQHFKKTGVEFIVGRITDVQRDKRIVHVGKIEVPYDYLLFDLGSEPETEGIPGIEHALSRSGAIGMLELRSHLATQFMKLRDTNKPQHRTFVVAGASVSGIETVTAMQTLIKELCEKHLIFPHEIALILVEQENTEYPLTKGTLNKIKRILEEKNIEYYPGKIHQYTPAGVDLGDITLETETLVWSAKKRANRLLKTLQLSIDGYGALKVNSKLRTDDPHIFAVGDCASIHTNQTIPRTAFMAYDEQQTIAENLISVVNGKTPEDYIPRKPVPVLITTGDSKALLVTSWYSWYGKVPYKIKNWIAQKYARRVRNT